MPTARKGAKAPEAEPTFNLSNCNVQGGVNAETAEAFSSLARASQAHADALGKIAEAFAKTGSINTGISIANYK